MSTKAQRYDVEDPEVDAVAEVRHWVLGHLEQWKVVGRMREELLLVTSELVTNALRHARTSITVFVRPQAEGCVRVEVFDRDTRLPMAVSADDDATSGRGLHIVAAVAADWGSRTEERDGIHGKVVWADVCGPDDSDGPGR